MLISELCKMSQWNWTYMGNKTFKPLLPLSVVETCGKKQKQEQEDRTEVSSRWVLPLIERHEPIPNTAPPLWDGTHTSLCTS